MLVCSVLRPFLPAQEKGSWPPASFPPSKRPNGTQPNPVSIFLEVIPPSAPSFVCHHHCTVRACTPPRALPSTVPCYPFLFASPAPTAGCAPSSSCRRTPPALLALSAGLCHFVAAPRLLCLPSPLWDPCTRFGAGAAWPGACLHAGRERAPRRMRACRCAAPCPFNSLTLKPIVFGGHAQEGCPGPQCPPCLLIAGAAAPPPRQASLLALPPSACSVRLLLSSSPAPIAHLSRALSTLVSTPPKQLLPSTHLPTQLLSLPNALPCTGQRAPGRPSLCKIALQSKEC